MEQLQLNIYNVTNKQKYYDVKIHDKDHVATPRHVVESIYNIINIKQYKMIWLPFNNYDSEFKLHADELLLKYQATHLFDDVGNDFFKIDPPSGSDLLISNPPFSLQNQIIERTFEFINNGLIKSFALLLPLSTLETRFRADLWEMYKDKLSILIFKKRIKFLGKKTSFNQACCWICYNIKNLEDKKILWI